MDSSFLPCILKLINYSCSSYPTRASYSGQVNGFRNRTENTAVFEMISNMAGMQISLICILIKQEIHMTINKLYLITHFTK